MRWKEGKSPRDAINSIKDIDNLKHDNNNRSGCLFMVLVLFTIAFGFFSLMLYGFSVVNKNFVGKAIETQAIIEKIELKRSRRKSDLGEAELVERGNRIGGNKKFVRERLDVHVLTLRFYDRSKNEVITKYWHEVESVYSVGDQVKILYDPEIPTKVMLYENKNQSQGNRDLSKYLFFLFLGCLSIVILMTRKKERH